MAIYVDPLVSYGRRGAWAHMMTDGDVEELHAFARRIGLKRHWAHKLRSNHPHYDLRAGKRAQAIAAGATPVSHTEIVKRCSTMYWNRESATDHD